MLFQSSLVFQRMGDLTYAVWMELEPVRNRIAALRRVLVRLACWRSVRVTIGKTFRPQNSLILPNYAYGLLFNAMLSAVEEG